MTSYYDDRGGGGRKGRSNRPPPDGEDDDIGDGSDPRYEQRVREGPPYKVCPACRRIGRFPASLTGIA